jgi:hypothetical protein
MLKRLLFRSVASLFCSGWLACAARLRVLFEEFH